MKKTVKKLNLDVTTVRVLKDLKEEQQPLVNGGAMDRSDGCGGSRAGIC